MNNFAVRCVFYANAGGNNPEHSPESCHSYPLL